MGEDLTERHPLDWEKIKTLKDLKAIFMAINIKFTKQYAQDNNVEQYLNETQSWQNLKEKSELAKKKLNKRQSNSNATEKQSSKALKKASKKTALQK